MQKIKKKKRDGTTLFIKILEFLRHFPKPRVDKVVYAALGVRPIRAGHAGWHAGQDLDAIVYGGDRPYMERFVPDRSDHLFLEHEILHVGCRDHDALLPGKALGLADGEVPFDLFVHAADWLDLPFLVHRTGDGDVLADGRPGKRREDRIELGARRTVPVDAAQVLLSTVSGEALADGRLTLPARGSAILG